jgi:aspartyl-tRNA(Asn)/glutamyl-tRNA(Gln) amidotransferase subunit A
VADAAIVFEVIAGHDPLDSTSLPGPRPELSALRGESLAGIRLGVARQYMSDANSPDVTAAMNLAIRGCQELGAQIVEVDLPHTQYGVPVYYIVATAEASSNLARFDGVRYGHRAASATDLIDLYASSRAEGFGPEVKRRIMLGTYAIVCPTMVDAAFRIGEKSADPLAMYLNDIYTVNCNLAGLPGLSVPVSMSSSAGTRLPVGVQLIGPALSESRLLRIGGALERIRKNPIFDDCPLC